MMNYDVNALAVLSDVNGFILGESKLGVDTMTTEAGAWADIKGEFTALEVEHSVSLDKGSLFRPETSTCSLRTRYEPHSTRLFGRRIKVQYTEGGVAANLFEGRIKNVGVEVDRDGDSVFQQIVITANSRLEVFNNTVLNNFTAPAETTLARFNRIRDAFLLVANEEDFSAITLAAGQNPRNMPAITKPVNATALELMQEVADAQLGRFYMSPSEDLLIKAEPVTAATKTLTDIPADTTLPSYTYLNMSENRDNALSGVSVFTPGAEGATDGLRANRRLSSARSAREEAFEVFLAPSQSEVNAWVESFPLVGATSLVPSNVDLPYDSTYVNGGVPGVTDLINVKFNGHSYEAGVRSISYSIGRDKFLINLGLMPSTALKYQAIAPPSQPRNLEATAIAVTTVTLGWQAPAYKAGITGYELRYSATTTPPATRSDGIFVATLSASDASYHHTGRSGKTVYSYSLFPLTNTAGVVGEKATLTVTTN